MRLTLKYVRRDVAWSGFALVALVTDVVLPPLGDVERTVCARQGIAASDLPNDVLSTSPSGGSTTSVTNATRPEATTPNQT
jgi:hypothetical protein